MSPRPATIHQPGRAASASSAPHLAAVGIYSQHVADGTAPDLWSVTGT